MEKQNIFHNEKFPQQDTEEIFEQILATENIIIERIISTGQTTPENKWYDQEMDEWVLLLQGKAHITFDGNKCIELEKGDYILIKAHCRHRVTFTSSNPSCIWLAVYIRKL